MNKDSHFGKLPRTQRKSKVGLSRPGKQRIPQREPLQIAPDMPVPPTPAALAAAVANAAQRGDFGPAVSCARAVLLARDPAADPYAAMLADLLGALETRDSAPSWLPVHFDGRVEECFEQMLSLVHQQNIQIAELWRIAADFI